MIPSQPWGPDELAQFTDDELHRTMVGSEPGSNHWELMKAELEHRDRKRKSQGNPDSTVEIPANAAQLLQAISIHSGNSPTPVSVTDLGLKLDERTVKSAWEYLRDRNLITTYTVPFTARVNANGTELLEKMSGASRPSVPTSRAAEHVNPGERAGTRWRDGPNRRKGSV